MKPPRADLPLVIVVPTGEKRRVEVRSAGDPVPHTDYYEVSRRGLHRVRHRGLQHSRLPVDEVPSLEQVDPFVRLALEPVPAEGLLGALDFHRMVIRREGTESILLLYYDIQRRCYRFECPDQWIPPEGHGRRDSVEYAFAPSASATELRVGDVHCHLGFSASPSSTDLDDARKTSPGLHAIWGYAETDFPELSLTMVVERLAFRASCDRWVKGQVPKRIPFNRPATCPLVWMNRVHEQPPRAKGGGSGGIAR